MRQIIATPSLLIGCIVAVLLSATFAAGAFRDFRLKKEYQKWRREKMKTESAVEQQAWKVGEIYLHRLNGFFLGPFEQAMKKWLDLGISEPTFLFLVAALEAQKKLSSFIDCFVLVGVNDRSKWQKEYQDRRLTEIFQKILEESELLDEGIWDRIVRRYFGPKTNQTEIGNKITALVTATYQEGTANLQGEFRGVLKEVAVGIPKCRLVAF